MEWLKSYKMNDNEFVQELDKKVRKGKLQKRKERHFLNRWGKIPSGEIRSNIIVYIYMDLNGKDLYRVTHKINERANYHHILIEEYVKGSIAAS